MSDINALSSLNVPYIIVGAILLFVVAEFIIKKIDFFREKFGLESKFTRQRREDHELLLATVTKIEEVNNNSIAHDKRLEEKVDSIYNSLSTVSNILDEVTGTIKSMENRINASEVATMESLNDRINQKYKHYLKIKGIPEDEVDEFYRLHAAYKGVGGNHSGDAKFEYCVKNLPILPSTKGINNIKGE